MDAKSKLEKFLEDEGLSQSDVAREIGCDPSFISRVLRGEKRLVGAFAFRLEDLTSEWEAGPIDAREWVRDLI